MTPDPWGAPAGDTGLSWAELRDAWLEAQTPNTRRAYRHGLRAFWATLPPGTTPADVRAKHVIDFRDQLRQRVQEATVKGRIAAVSSFYAFAQRPAGTDSVPARLDNPAARIPLGKLQMYGRARKLPVDEFRRLLRASSGRTRAWLLAHALTGRRRSEIARLSSTDLEHDGTAWWYSYIGKGGKHRRRQIPAVVVKAIEDWQGRSLFEVCAALQPGLPIWGCSQETLARELKATARRAGMEPKRVCIHALRHVAAALRREDGADIREIQEFLDHSNPSTTLIYMQAMEEQRDSRADSIGRRLLDGD